MHLLGDRQCANAKVYVESRETPRQKNCHFWWYRIQYSFFSVASYQFVSCCHWYVFTGQVQNIHWHSLLEFHWYCDCFAWRLNVLHPRNLTNTITSKWKGSLVILPNIHWGSALSRLCESKSESGWRALKPQGCIVHVHFWLGHPGSHFKVFTRFFRTQSWWYDGSGQKDGSPTLVPSLKLLMAPNRGHADGGLTPRVSWALQVIWNDKTRQDKSFFFYLLY